MGLVFAEQVANEQGHTHTRRPSLACQPGVFEGCRSDQRAHQPVPAAQGDTCKPGPSSGASKRQRQARPAGEHRRTEFLNGSPWLLPQLFPDGPNSSMSASRLSTAISRFFCPDVRPSCRITFRLLLHAVFRALPRGVPPSCGPAHFPHLWPSLGLAWVAGARRNGMSPHCCSEQLVGS